MKRRTILKTLTLLPATLLMPRHLLACLERRDSMFPLVGPYNDALRKNYPLVYRYLNVVDIGHAELSEKLLTNPQNEARAVHLIEQVTFDRVRHMSLDPRKAPRLAPAEETVAPESVKVAWR